MEPGNPGEMKFQSRAQGSSDGSSNQVAVLVP
jgi:hypothetical protein